MPIQTSLRRGLFGLALGVILTLLFAPQTGWLVRRQTLALLMLKPLPGQNSDYSPSEAKIQQVAAQQPNDEQLQYAAVQEDDREKYIVHLRALESRFPDNASLRANLLRHYTRWQVRLHRPEVALFYQTLTMPDASISPIQNTPQQLTAFDQEATAGERLDPDNAYFPFMRAVGLYAAHRDADAQTELLRAGRLHVWREYYNDDVMARWRLRELADGNLGALWRASVAGAVLLPHYAALRTVTCLAVYQASQYETHGHIQEGLALRMAIFHIGGLMRVQSTAGIGSMVGIALTKLAMQRAGGAPFLERRESNSETEVSLAPLVSSFGNYARQHGFSEAARFANAESDAGIQANGVLQTSPSGITWLSKFSPFADSADVLGYWWIAGMLVLANALWLFLLSVFAALLSRTRCAQNKQSSTGWFFVGVTLGFMVSLGPLYLTYEKQITKFLSSKPEWSIFVLGGLVFAAIISSIAFMIKRQKPIRGLRVLLSLGIACATVIIIQAINGLVQLQGNQITSCLTYLGAYARSDGIATALSFMPLYVLASVILFVMLSLTILCIRSMPLFVGLVQSCAKWALPCACLLILIYGGVTLETLRKDKIEDAVLTQSMQGEGAYIARMTGQIWPGIVND